MIKGRQEEVEQETIGEKKMKLRREKKNRDKIRTGTRIIRNEEEKKSLSPLLIKRSSRPSTGARTQVDDTKSYWRTGKDGRDEEADRKRYWKWRYVVERKSGRQEGRIGSQEGKEEEVKRVEIVGEEREGRKRNRSWEVGKRIRLSTQGKEEENNEKRKKNKEEELAE